MKSLKLNSTKNFKFNIFLLILAVIFTQLVLMPPVRSEPGNISPSIANQLEQLRGEITRNGYKFKVGYSSAMEYSVEELCGLLEPVNWQEKASFKKMESMVGLPASFDWRALNGVTPIRNQGGCGSCWAFATVGVLESKIKIDCGETVDLSEQYLVSCNESGWSCSGGWWAHDYHWFRTPPQEPAPGAVLEADFGYAASNLPCNPPHPHPFVIDGWYTVGSDTAAIKQAIFNYGPVAAAVVVGSAFQAYQSGVFDVNLTGTVNHGILLVGWDNDYYDDGSNVGVWILRNSWGTGWGEDGYMYIEYGASRVGYAANYVNFSACNEPIVLSVPNGGETIPSGQEGYTISWEAPERADHFTLKYSLNGGKTWVKIAQDITGSEFSNWQAPTPVKNKRQCLIKVIAFDDLGNNIGKDTSDSFFTIEVVKLITPDNEPLTLNPEDIYTISWLQNMTKRDVERVVLKYTLNNGIVWKKLDILTDNFLPGTYEYNWTVPSVKNDKTQCKVKVLLKDSNGKIIGKDKSDNHFTIQSNE